MTKVINPNHEQIIEELKLIFIHIPKTGGTFIENRLYLLARIINSKKYLRFSGHHSISSLNEKYSEYTSFCVVRNPYDRLISAYNYLRSRNDKYHKRFLKLLKDPEDLNEFVRSIEEIYKINNGQMSGLMSVPHIIPQYYFCCNEKQMAVKSILKYEFLDRDFKKFIGHFKKQPLIYAFLYILIYKQILIKPTYSKSNLSDRSVQIINSVYHYDFTLFDYPFMNCTSQIN